MKQSKVFGRSSLKVEPTLQNEIIERFNTYDLLIRVMEQTSGNLKDIALSLKAAGNLRDAEDIYYLAKRLRDATKKEWQKDNHLYY